MPDDKPRLLWHSNSPTASTGYGQQTALFLPHLTDRYNVACSAFYGVEGNIIPWNGIPIMPGIAQTYGDQTIVPHADKFFGGDPQGGTVFTLMDVWVLDPAVWGQLNTACWTPVDHQPAPDAVVRFFIDSGAIPVAMSRFGERMLRDANLDPLYVPHAVDTEVFRPVHKDQARESTGMPQDRFIVGMVAANKGNPSRKCFHEAFAAFKQLHDRHPDSLLYLHTELSGMFQGVNLPNLLRKVGVPSDALLFCDQYRAVHFPFEPAKLAAMYSSLDALLAPSAGEGFGVPVLEAQACGTPVIVSDFSAQPELVGAGWKVNGRQVYTPAESWQYLPDVKDIYRALLHSHDCSPDKRVQMSHAASAFAQDYDIRKVVDEYMLPALEEAQQRFEDRRPVELAVAA